MTPNFHLWVGINGQREKYWSYQISRKKEENREHTIFKEVIIQSFKSCWERERKYLKQPERKEHILMFNRIQKTLGWHMGHAGRSGCQPLAGHTCKKTLSTQITFKSWYLEYLQTDSMWATAPYKMGEILNRYFTQEEIQVSRKQNARYLILLIIKNWTLIKTTMWSHHS